RHSPLAVDQDLLPSDVRVEAVTPDADVPVLRLTDRGRLLDQVDEQCRQFETVAELQTFDAFHRQAFNLLSSPATARAFDLATEPSGVRARYGATQFGQRCLLARRLAEAGVPMINVHFCHTPEGSWDTHSRHFSQMKCPSEIVHLTRFHRRNALRRCPQLPRNRSERGRVGPKTGTSTEQKLTAGLAAATADHPPI